MVAGRRRRCSSASRRSEASEEAGAVERVGGMEKEQQGRRRINELDSLRDYRTTTRVGDAAGACPGGGQRRRKRCARLPAAIRGAEKGDKQRELAVRVQLVGKSLIPFLLGIFILLGIHPPPSSLGIDARLPERRS